MVLKRAARNHANESNYQYGIKAGAPRVLALHGRATRKATVCVGGRDGEFAQHLAQAGLTVGEVAKAHESRPHVVDLLKDGRIDLVVNTTAGQQAIRDSYTLRRQALMSRTSYYTTMAGARALVEALRRVTAGELDVAPLQSYFPVVE